MHLLSTNPATGGVLRTLPSLTEGELQVRIAQAAAASEQQAATPAELRTRHLGKLAALLDEERDDLARLLALESGKPVLYGRDEVAACANLCRYFAEHGARLLLPELLSGGPGQAHVQYNPLGVVLAAMPRSSPLWHGFRFAVPALAAGNAVLMKHERGVPQVSLRMAALVRRAGFAPGVFTSLLMHDELVETALNDDRIAAVTVTGSLAAGRALAAQAGWLLKRSAVHLLGNDPFVVMPSADLNAAAAAAVRAIAEGESAAKRIVLHESIFHAFVGRLVAALEALRIGNPLQEETAVGPLGTAGAMQALAEQVDAAVAGGGRILTGGTRMVGAGNFYEPTLLSDVPESVARVTLQGPVAMVFRVSTAEDAVALANSSGAAAAGAVWTRDPSEQQHLLTHLPVGSVALNTLHAYDPRLPVNCGCGCELGTAGLRGLLRAKTVSLG